MNISRSNNMRDLLKGTLQSSMGVAFMLLFGAIVVKVIAVVNGPEGVGLFSVLRQLQQTGAAVALVGGQTAIIQGLAKFEDKQQQQFLWSAFYIVFFATLITVLAIILSAPLLSHYIFTNKVSNSTQFIGWSTVPIIFSVIFSFLSSVLNGHRLLGHIAGMQLVAAVAGSCIVYPLALWFNTGNTLAYILLLAVPFLLGSIGAFWINYQRGFLSPLFNKTKITGRALLRSYEASYFMAFASTTLFTTLAQGVALLSVRALIVKKYGLSGAGEFDAAWTLSMTYVMLILNSFAGYYLPTLSKIIDKKARGELVESVIKLSIAITIPLITGVIVFKALYIKLFYSIHFLSSLEMIHWMLIGDYLKIISWIFAMSMLAYAQMKLFLITEILWSVGFLLASALAIHYYNSLEVIGVIFLISNLCYLIFASLYIRTKWQFYINKKTVLFCCSGLIYLLIVSVATWHQTTVNWWAGIIWVLLSVLVVTLFVGNTVLAVLKKKMKI